MKAIVFGASNLGRKVYNYIKDKYEVVAFCDNDKNKWGTKLEGLDICPPYSLINKEITVVIASMYHIEIALQLINNNILKFAVYSDLNSESLGLNYYNYENRDITLKRNKVSFIKDNNSGSNTLTLYSYLVNDSDLEVVLLNEKDDKDKDYYYHICTSNVIVKSHEGSYVEGKINIQLWHGIPLKGLGFMNACKRADCEKRHNIWNKSIIISYSQMYSVLMGACYGVNLENFKITGLPRNDLLLRSSGREKIAKLFPIQDKKIVFYLPTYRESSYGEKNGVSSGYIFNSEEPHLDVLDKYLSDSNIMLISKMHPFEEKQYERYFEQKEFKNIFLLKEQELRQNYIDLYDILNASDCLITDYSSVYFDYLLLDKPIIFFNKDIDEYSKSRGFLLEPYNYWTPGEKCTSVLEIIKELEELNDLKNDKYKVKRKEIKEIFHKYEDGNSCKRIKKIILDLI